MELRRVPADHPALTALTGELDGFFRAVWGAAAEGYQKYHDLSKMACALVAFDGAGAPAGCGCWKPLDGGRAEIKRMYVRPACRRRGVAAALLAALEEDALSRGCTAAVLETGAEMPQAIRFYEARGYRLIPNYGEFVGDEVCVCMKKELEGQAQCGGGQARAPHCARQNGA